MPGSPALRGQMSESEEIIALHDAAVAKGEMFYRDPQLGAFVMTSLCHQRRGACCGRICRHCPFPPEEQIRPPGYTRR